MPSQMPPLVSPQGESIDIVTQSEADTAAVGARLARELRPGAIIHLFGDLGAGKTVFVRGLAAGLGLDPDEVSSPTLRWCRNIVGRSRCFTWTCIASLARRSPISSSTR